METHVTESGFSSMSDDYDAIDTCPCEEDDEDTLRPVFSSDPVYTGTWEPIVLYRKERKRHSGRSKNGRCSFHQTRIVQKSGRAAELIRKQVQRRYARYLRDLSNTMVNGRWRWVTCALVLTISALWLVFAWFWMLVSTSHGDLEVDLQDGTVPNDTCVVGVEGFAGFLLMSIETQTTIGYGSRYPTENCPEGVFILCLQMILGIGVEGAVLGMFYVKMTRPRTRDSRKLFSKISVVCQRDGVMCLMFRVCDEERAHIVGTQLRAYLTETRCTPQGEYVEAFQQPLMLDSPGFLLWPLTIVHRIVPGSPLYDVSARDLLVRKFEIIVTMIGSSDSTGQLTQSRTSYLASEIYWGHRFKPCVHYDEDKTGYVVHRDMFSATEQVDTPLCSSQRLDEVLQDIQDHSMEATISSGMSSLPADTISLSPVPSTSSPVTIRLEDIQETSV